MHDGVRARSCTRASNRIARLRRAGGEGGDAAAARPQDGHAEGSEGLQDHRQADARRRQSRRSSPASRSSASTSRCPACCTAVFEKCPVFGGKVVEREPRRDQGACPASATRSSSRAAPRSRTRLCRRRRDRRRQLVAGATRRAQKLKVTWNEGADRVSRAATASPQARRAVEAGAGARRCATTATSTPR